MFDKALLRFSEHASDNWSINDALKGVSIIGGTGSGKTSASGKTIALKYLEQGWGGLVLCAKSDEAELWKSYCSKVGRDEDLLIFGKDSIHTDGEFQGERMIFNAIGYEMDRPGNGAGDTMNLTNIFMNIYRMGNRISGEGNTKEERYWDNALKRCLNRVIELIKLANEKLTYDNMVKLLSSTFELTEEKFIEEHEFVKEYDDRTRINKPENYCIKCLVDAYKINFKQRKADKETENSYTLVYFYFLQDIPNMGERTRTTITESFMGLAEPFLSGILYKHFSGITNVLPEWTYERKKIIVLDFPVKEYLDSGILAQCVFKLLFQQAIERRNVNQFPTPIFLWADEAQYFINPYDQIFLTTARSSRTATVFLSQNISNYFSIMSKPQVDSLMGNLSTKIFHANSDAETNEYASRLIGNELQYLGSMSESKNPHINFLTSKSETLASHYLPQVHPKVFTTLKSGGKENDYQVEAIILVSGRAWSDGRNYNEISFEQQFT